jgi:methionyl-tRNA synthetase
VLGKDILKFHAVIWPALLMAAGLDLPRQMVIHGYLLMGEKKMSKSLGNVLDPFAAIERYGSDALRFYCFREVSFGQDGNVSAAGFESRYETELANDLGNLASRTLAMIERYRDGVVPEAELDVAIREGEEGLDGLVERVCALLDDAELTTALEEMWSRVRRLNRYVEEARPWDLAKDPAKAADLDRVLYSLAEGLRVLALLLHPYIPVSTAALLRALGEPERALAEPGSRGGGTRVERIPPLYPKLEPAEGE